MALQHGFHEKSERPHRVNKADIVTVRCNTTGRPQFVVRNAALLHHLRYHAGIRQVYNVHLNK
jgi:hypothetical protein